METNVVSFPTIVSSRRSVPNEQPIREPDSYRIAFVGEAPGEHEENHRRPFVGPSGQVLTNILNDVGIDRTKCLVGNVCQFRPPGNRIESFDWDGPEIQDGLAKLNEDIRTYNPHIVVALGNTPLRAARGPCKITDWRGSLFTSNVLDGPFFGRKCVASLHPAFVLREFSGFPLLKFDLKRAADEGKSPELVLPKRELIINASVDELCYMMNHWLSGQRCSVDIEGGLPRDVVNVKRLTSKGKYKSKFGWTCVSLSARPTKAYTIVWNKFSPEDHGRLLQSFARLMYRYDVPKVLQNQLYDNFVLSYGYGIPIRNVTEDVMIKGWAVYAELPRSLSVQASVWTREPHWKDETMYVDRGEGLYQGCATDSAVTLEICNTQDQVLTGPELQHYRSMIQIENPFHYMEQRGMLYDLVEVAQQTKKNDEDMSPIRERLAQSAGYDLCGKTSLSQKKLVNCLYVEKRYPPQYKIVIIDGVRTKKLTTDIEALLNLKKITSRQGLDDPFINDIVEFRHLEGVRETLNIPADPDGRVRCGYSLEAETGRVKCYTSPTGSGANMQTIQKDLRTVYIADPGMDFFQCDLEGADGNTVACHAAKLGDPNMLLDYQAKMKPAKIIALLYYFGRDINRMSRDDLKWLHDNVFPIVSKDVGKWLYLGCKRVQHGSSYLMGIPTMILNVLKDSHKESGIPVYMEHSAARELQEGCFFARYPGVRTWHSWAESKLVADGELVSASGQKRIFFGRRFSKDIKETVKEFLAHEPQSNTTWATNLAMLNLWQDKENRRPDGSLIIEPLHQVHDALCGQWPSTQRDWARNKVRTYFQNTMEIAGVPIVIPFEGRYGRSWGELEHEI
jgi:uracil-DNA glycosylase family 4